MIACEANMDNVAREETQHVGTIIRTHLLEADAHLVPERGRPQRPAQRFNNLVATGVV